MQIEDIDVILEEDLNEDSTHLKNEIKYLIIDTVLTKDKIFWIEPGSSKRIFNTKYSNYGSFETVNRKEFFLIKKICNVLKVTIELYTELK